MPGLPKPKTAKRRIRAFAHRFGKYLGVQLLAYGLDFALFMAAVKLFFWPAVVGNIFSKSLSGTFSFAAHRHFTFRPGAHGLKKEALRYYLLLAVNTGASSAAIFAFGFILPVVWAKLIADGLCFLIGFILVQNHVFAFKTSDPPQP